MPKTNLRIVFLCFVCLFVYSADQIEAPGHHVCGEPADPQLLPNHSGLLQLPAASQEYRPVLIQDDSHLGLHCLPAHHEWPAACHWRYHTSHESVDNTFDFCLDGWSLLLQAQLQCNPPDQQHQYKRQKSGFESEKRNSNMWKNPMKNINLNFQRYIVH